MGRAGLVEARGWVRDSRHDLVGDEMVEEQDVGLLDDLCPGHSFGSEQEIGGDRATRCHAPQ